jgi:hypothetical protein
MSIQATTAQSMATLRVSPYAKFKMALKSKEVQRQYPNLLERFLDFGRFEGLDVEQKATKFYEFVKSKTSDEVEDLVIGCCFLFLDRFDNPLT